MAKKYRIIKTIGTGCTSTVYEVEHNDTHKLFVDKVFTDLELCQEEYKMVKKIEPSLVECQDSIQGIDKHFFIMSRFGDDLNHFLTLNMKLSKFSILAIGRAVIS